MRAFLIALPVLLYAAPALGQESADHEGQTSIEVISTVQSR